MPGYSFSGYSVCSRAKPAEAREVRGGEMLVQPWPMGGLYRPGPSAPAFMQSSGGFSAWEKMRAAGHCEMQH